MAAPGTARILAIAELSDAGTLEPTTVASTVFARQLAAKLRTDWALLVTASESQEQYAPAQSLGATTLYCCRTSPTTQVEHLAATLCRLVEERTFVYVVASESMNGQGLLPRLAGMLDAAYIGGCVGIRSTQGGVRFLRPIYAGVAIAHCEASSPVVVIAARPSVFADTFPAGPRCPVEQLRAIAAGVGATPRMRCLTASVAGDRPALAEARVVVAGGRALGSRFFETLGPLADRLGAAIGATRAACDAGHAPGCLQIGQTGCVVAPELYLAVGLSGSVQHIAGMRGAKLVVAINQDPEAPIFAHADYGIVGDLWQVIPQLLTELDPGHLADCSPVRPIHHEH